MKGLPGLFGILYWSPVAPKALRGSSGTMRKVRLWSLESFSPKPRATAGMSSKEYHRDLDCLEAAGQDIPPMVALVMAKER
ncbi:hypothetical protein BDN72DRAFT_835760 [Pluteus cervinus]|uniref:Uncharacterized protein n=1 Tax=Pluteus cervinus TaxID=181527 RepID=A0ACD3B3L5_9AGAR|nr:hypothetical protein BDN72DRAFT_835760 [Pluteus cervinus]